MKPLVKKAGIEKAKDRLRAAQEHYTKCLSSTTHAEYVKAWGDFLIAGAAIAHVIESASRHTPQGKQWYGSRKNHARRDPLILYMYQARNEQEHGIEPVTTLIPAKMTLTVPDGGALTRVPTERDGTAFEFLSNPDNYIGTVPGIKISPPRPDLLPVTSKEGDVFHPPQEHLGQPLMYGSPDEVATKYLSYLEVLITEADGLS